MILIEMCRSRCFSTWLMYNSDPMKQMYATKQNIKVSRHTSVYECCYIEWQTLHISILEAASQNWLS